ncbi:MAG: hypothetical protein GXO90_03185, partial [FCB group bacterium]|nr:hypothetical protein [FCB group bacterium]
MNRLLILLTVILLGGLFAGPSGRIPFTLRDDSEISLLNQCILLNDWISKSPEIHFDLPTTRYLLRIKYLSDRLTMELETGNPFDYSGQIREVNRLIELFNRDHVRIISRKFYPNQVNRYYFWS